MSALDDLERSLVGSVFLDSAVLSTVSIEPCEFFNLKAQHVWSAFRRLDAKAVPIDVVTVESDLEAAGVFQAIGFDFLGDCAIRVPHTKHAGEYARQIREAYLGRSIRLALSELLQNTEATGSEILTDALASLARFDAEQPAEALTIGELARLRAGELERIAQDRMNGTAYRSGCPTGVVKLDEVVGGWQPGIVSIVAARPGMGKSSLGMSTADAATEAGYGTHVFSLEDTRTAYTDRALSRRSLVPSEVIRSCNYDEGTFRQVSDGMNALKLRKGWIVDDRSGITADEIVRSVRRKRRENNTKIVIVDYIQLIRWPRDVRSAHEALTHAVTVLADAAKRDGIAYVVMSQLNRGVEQRADKRPQLSDLRESGSLEERAKCVVALYRGSYYDATATKGIDYAEGEPAPTETEFKQQAQLLVLKNSNGRTGTVRAQWHGPTTRIW